MRMAPFQQWRAVAKTNWPITNIISSSDIMRAQDYLKHYSGRECAG